MKPFCPRSCAPHQLTPTVHEIAPTTDALFERQDVGDLFCLGRNVASEPARERFGAGTLAQNVDVEEGSVLGFHAFGRGNGSVSIRCSASSRVTEEFIRQYCPACPRACVTAARR